MAAISALVVDDESWARRNLIVLLRSDPDIGEIVECDSGVRAQSSRSGGPKTDLLFLDVQMPGCDGFDVLEMLGNDLPPVVVFVTAYDEYALRAFEAGVLDYLLKPFDNARFRRALDRAKDKLAHYPSQRRPTAERLVVKTRGELQFLNVADVDWIESAAYYACLHIGSSTSRTAADAIRLGTRLGHWTRSAAHPPIDHRESQRIQKLGIAGWRRL